MKRLVLIGEGRGETAALPTLAARLLRDTGAADVLYPYGNVMRLGNISGLMTQKTTPGQWELSKWLNYLHAAAKQPDLGAVLTVFDGDAKVFPAGSQTPFCPCEVASRMALAAADAGAGHTFSLAVVFACTEFETWLVAGMDPVAALPKGMTLNKNTLFPQGDFQKYNKGWLETYLQPHYRPALHQKPLTSALNLELVRSRKLSSFRRMEHALDQLVTAVRTGRHVSTPDPSRNIAPLTS